MRGKRTSEEDKEKVKAVLYINPDASHADLAKATNIPESTVRGIRKDIELTDEFTEVRAKKKEEFINKAWELVGKLMLKMDDKLNTMTEDELKKVNIRDLAVAMGTTYDKQALANGEPTQISESAKPVNELIKDYDKKLEQYKKLVNQ